MRQTMSKLMQYDLSVWLYRTYARSYDSSHFGRGKAGPIFFENLNCTGHEVDLFDCHFLSIRNLNCNHTQDVGVNCGMDFILLLKKYMYVCIWCCCTNFIKSYYLIYMRVKSLKNNKYKLHLKVIFCANINRCSHKIIIPNHVQ